MDRVRMDDAAPHVGPAGHAGNRTHCAHCGKPLAIPQRDERGNPRRWPDRCPECRRAQEIAKRKERTRRFYARHREEIRRYMRERQERDGC